MRHITRITIALLSVALVSCANDDIAVKCDDSTGNVTITLSVGDFHVFTPDSRGLTLSDEMEVASEAEKRIDDVWIFQYGTDGRLLQDPVYKTVSYPGGTVGVSVNLVENTPCTICVVANTGTPSWANATNRSRFATLAGFEQMDIPNSCRVTKRMTDDYDYIIYVPQQVNRRADTLRARPQVGG